VTVTDDLRFVHVFDAYTSGAHPELSLFIMFNYHTEGRVSQRPFGRASACFTLHDADMSLI